MNKIKYDSELIKLITLFESMSGAKVKDCIANERLTFIIEENEMGKAIGKNGANIRKIEGVLKKKIKLAEFNNDILQFIKNMIKPIEIHKIEQEGTSIIMYCNDTNTKAKLIGREKQNINYLTNIVKRYFDIKDIKVI